MIPAFRIGEVVRIERLNDKWTDENRWVVGEEGIVDSVAGPNEAGTGWTYSVWINEPEPVGPTLWMFDEEEVASLGFVENDEAERRPVAESDPLKELRDSLYLRLITAVTDVDEASRVADIAKASLLSFVQPRGIDVRLDRHWHEPFHYEILVTIEPERDALKAFDDLVALSESGWINRDDDGWQCDYWWSQRDAEPGAVLLAPEVHNAHVVLQAWNTPHRRPVSERRASASPG